MTGTKEGCASGDCGACTAVVGELNALDLGATGTGTAIASKVVTTDASIDTTGQRNLTITGELDAATLDISGNADIDGTLNTDGLTNAGNFSTDGGTIKLDGNYPTGTGNVALGDAALSSGSLSGGNNTVIGRSVGAANTSGADNTAMGSFSLCANISGVS